METSQAIAVAAQRSALIRGQNRSGSIWKERFVATLSKGDIELERSASEAMNSGRRPFELKDLLRFDGIVQTGSGIFIDTKILNPIVHATLQLIGASSMTLMEQQRINAERIATIRQLHGLGYQVLVLDFGISPASGIEEARRYARIFKARPPIVGRMGKKVEYDSSVVWSRDLWQKFEGIRIAHFSRNGENPAGEGGMSVPINDRNTITSEKLRDDPVIRMLAKRGHRFYFMKDGFRFLERLSGIFSKEAYMTNDHTDLFVGAVANIMLVHGGYFVGQNKTLLRQAAKENKMKLLFVPHEESRIYPSNFLLLDRSRILVDQRAVKTIGLLREEGIDVVPTDVPLTENMKFGGGVRCFVNEL
jgi:hypothetical protein